MSLKIAFIDSHNSARGPMAEAILHQKVNGTYLVYSAGYSPAKKIDPLTSQTLERLNVEKNIIRKLYPKGINLLRDISFDYIISFENINIQDYLEGANSAVIANWLLPDPASVENPAKRRQAFWSLGISMNARVLGLIEYLEQQDWLNASREKQLNDLIDLDRKLRNVEVTSNIPSNQGDINDIMRLEMLARRIVELNDVQPMRERHRSTPRGQFVSEELRPVDGTSGRLLSAPVVFDEDIPQIDEQFAETLATQAQPATLRDILSHFIAQITLRKK